MNQVNILLTKGTLGSISDKMDRCCCTHFVCGTRTTRQTDSRWSFVVLLCAALTQAVIFGTAYAYGVLLPPLMDYFDESRERTAWIGSLMLGCSLAVGPLAGGVINRFGCRVAAVCGCLFFSLAMCLSSLATSIYTMYFTYGILGAFGINFTLMSSMVIVAKYFKKWQSTAVALSSTSIGIGTTTMSAVLQGLLDVLGWRHALRVVSGAAFLLMALVACVFNPNVSTDGTDDRSRQNSDSRANPSSRRCLSIDWSVCRQPFVLVMTATSCVESVTRITPFVHLVKYGLDVGIAEDKAAMLFLFMGVFMAVGRLTTAALLSVMRRINTMYLFQASLCFMGVAMLLVAPAKTYIHFIAFAVMFGFFDGMHIALFHVQMMVRIRASQRASALGIVFLTNAAFTVGGPPFSGFLADKLGSYQPAFYFSGALTIAGSAIPFLLLCVKNSADGPAMERTELTQVEIIERETQV